jgi:hypothetical protein
VIFRAAPEQLGNRACDGPSVAASAGRGHRVAASSDLVARPPPSPPHADWEP